MSPVGRRIGVAFLQFLSGSALLYLAIRLSAHDPAVEAWVGRLVDKSSFGRDWWKLVLTGLGGALVLLSLPSPWRGDRPAPARKVAVRAPSPDAERPRRLAEKPIVGAPTLREPAAPQVVSPVLQPPLSTPAYTPSFRSKPSPARPLRKLVVTRQSSLVEE